MELSALEESSQTLRAHIEAKDVAKASELLTKLKRNLIALPSLPPCGIHSSTAIKEIEIARHVFESATILSLLLKDLIGFERNVIQLKIYYSAAFSALPPSDLRYTLIGARLLQLLIENRMAEFHNELEILTEADRKDANIAFGIKLEHYLMEGSYNKVLDARQHVPNELFSFFLAQLLQTVRENIADCAQVAYQCLEISDAQRMLMFGSAQELANYLKEKRPEWIVKGSMIWFKAPDKKLGASDIPSLRLVGDMLAYATELERIV